MHGIVLAFNMNTKSEGLQSAFREALQVLSTKVCTLLVSCMQGRQRALESDV